MDPLPLPAWIFFDVGWTLVDEMPAHLKRFDAVRRAMPGGVGPEAAELFRRYEAGFTARVPDPFARILEECGLPPAERGRYPFDHEVTRLYRGAGPALRALRGVMRLGVLANQSKGLTERLDGFGLGGLFDLVLGSADCGFAKPDPRLFAYAAERAASPPASLLMVGDRLDNDIGPARRAGWRTAWVRRGPHAKCEPSGPAETPDLIVSKLTRLAALFVPEERLALARHLDAKDAIVSWPEKERDKRLVVEHLATRFAAGKDYSEKEVNALIVALHRFDDYALLRRELVDRGLLNRTADGSRYWRPQAGR